MAPRPDLGPKPRLGYTQSLIERVAERRTDQGWLAAAAADPRARAYVIGGRGAALDSPTTRVVAIDLTSGRIGSAGVLVSSRSDLAAVRVGGRILLAGGLFLISLAVDEISNPRLRKAAGHG